MGKDPKFSHPPITVLVYESHEYGSRNPLGHAPDPRLPPNFGKSSCGLTPHLPNSRHSRRRGLTISQVLSNGGSGAPGRERAERSRLPLNAHAALRKSTLEPGHICGGPPRGESGGCLFEALSEAYGGRTGTDRDAKYPHQDQRPLRPRPDPDFHAVPTGLAPAISSWTRRSTSAGSGAWVTERPITR